MAESISDYFEDEEGFRRDIKERDANFQKIARIVEKEAQGALAQKNIRPGIMGYCHAFWAEKKRILKEKHGIDWKTPQEMNPDIFFD